MRSFEDCRERIERANSHKEVFAKTWNSFLQDGPYESVVRVDDDGAGGIWVYSRYERLPVSLALDLGEFLYQLRATLDACIYQAAILESGKNPPPDEKALEFPICSTPEEFKNSGWKIRPLADKRRNIIEAVQPYNAPKLAPEDMVLNFNRTLSILNDWARKDRHRKIHLVGSRASDARPKLGLPDGVSVTSFIVAPGGGFLEDESQIVSFRLDGYVAGAKVQANPDLTIDIAALCRQRHPRAPDGRHGKGRAGCGWRVRRELLAWASSALLQILEARLATHAPGRHELWFTIANFAALGSTASIVESLVKVVHQFCQLCV